MSFNSRRPRLPGSSVTIKSQKACDVSSHVNIVVDEISGWLEEHLQPTLETSRREFLWQYIRIYDRWARFHIASPGIDDQVSLNYLIKAAEDGLREMASPKPARLWLQTIRSVPLTAVSHITMSDDLMIIKDCIERCMCLRGPPAANDRWRERPCRLAGMVGRIQEAAGDRRSGVLGRRSRARIRQSMVSVCGKRRKTCAADAGRYTQTSENRSMRSNPTQSFSCRRRSS